MNCCFRLRSPAVLGTLLVLAFSGLVTPAIGAEEFIPRRQEKPPGPPLSPEEALQKMSVPEGFSVELVAAEPQLVNPVSMTIDERGRFWVTESLEYPRRAPGPGRDRIKVLEDTDGDGRVDKTTIFADGLNIPSGIAVGYGGVWVANAPDILFMQDTDGDGVADTREVVVTGFGRDDTHELPNSLTWGPDGWLYGLNGVFNPSHIKHQGKEHHFTCALFRIHPRTRAFEVFAEGTSNPWGIAWDPEGSAFVSACVIDHLWHLVETGYYHRQGGPYPPYTWKMESIVEHKHQLAAYCGIHYFDSDAYPEPYRDKLYMGNVHAGAINVDKLQRDGATYFGTTEEDFLQANDVWFMPVVQKTGPDGCLYVLDWYDRFHCYQDANRDPAGVDRLHGRLYRIRYQDTPRAPRFDLAEETDAQLVERLHSPNVYFRDLAQRLLAERLLAERDSSETRPQLERLVMDASVARKTRMHALWSLVSTGRLEELFHAALLRHTDPGYRAWGVRAAGNFRNPSPAVTRQVAALVADPSADVRLQVVIAANKIEGLDAIALLGDALTHVGDDKILPNVIWQNLYPLLDSQGDRFLEQARREELRQAAVMREILPRAIERLLDGGEKNASTVAALLTAMLAGEATDGTTARAMTDFGTAAETLRMLTAKIQSGELGGPGLESLRKELRPELEKVFAEADHPLLIPAALLATTWSDPAGVAAVRARLASTESPAAVRLEALEALVAAGHGSVLEEVDAILSRPRQSSPEFRGAALAALGRLALPQVAEVVLRNYSLQEPAVQPKAIELLTQRASWSKALLERIGRDEIPATALHVNQVRQLLAAGDPELAEMVRSRWGSIRSGRNPEADQLIAEIRVQLGQQAGNPHRGQAVFTKLCAQCHKIHGQGQEVGPDITLIGRTTLDQLLSNVLDPSLVIGVGYQQTNVLTVDGRVLSGIAVESNPQRVVLKLQGGKTETIPRDEIEQERLSELSMMPEELEKQLSRQELLDLLTFLALDKPPSDPNAKSLPGVAEIKVEAGR
ncbi:PVC-type heme-binding CxxCH protein [Candidatus Laterigemmans baculatus]|uniref:PVC-type heme-binding CxxCH protein n=1 Tax=Candidatus Laterigemmans baculatus TaxID=2770505 RepID=UPI0013DC1DD4|nr:PVC-type heme-binding CxxCH protein [Candidatus Laterigemmans baculatus]